MSETFSTTSLPRFSTKTLLLSVKPPEKETVGARSKKVNTNLFSIPCLTPYSIKLTLEPLNPGYVEEGIKPL